MPLKHSTLRLNESCLCLSTSCSNVTQRTQPALWRNGLINPRTTWTNDADVFSEDFSLRKLAESTLEHRFGPESGFIAPCRCKCHPVTPAVIKPVVLHHQLLSMLHSHLLPPQEPTPSLCSVMDRRRRQQLTKRPWNLLHSWKLFDLGSLQRQSNFLVMGRSKNY